MIIAGAWRRLGMTGAVIISPEQMQREEDGTKQTAAVSQQPSCVQNWPLVTLAMNCERSSPSADPMLAQRLRCWANIKSALAQRLLRVGSWPQRWSFSLPDPVITPDDHRTVKWRLKKIIVITPTAHGAPLFCLFYLLSRVPFSFGFLGLAHCCNPPCLEMFLELVECPFQDLWYGSELQW